MRYRHPSEFFRFHDERSPLEEIFEMMLHIVFAGVAFVCVIAAILLGLDQTFGTDLAGGFIDWLSSRIESIGAD